MAFEVSDTGIGIAPERLEAVFRPFEQADGSTARRYGGTGLGLSICDRLVRLLGGRLTAESEPGRGSTFRFVVPLQVAAEIGAPKVPPVGPAERPLRVLLAEDNPVNQAVASGLLEAEGHTVAVAPDGPAVLELLGRGPFDVVLMDVQMPGMDGFEVTARLRAREAAGGRRVPVVALTAHAMKGDRERCLQAGMDGYLSKPLRPGDLRRALAALAGASPAAGDEEPHAAAQVAGPEGGILDREELRKRTGGKADLLRELVRLFAEDWLLQRDALRAALAAGDSEALARVAHRLRGALVNLAAGEARSTATRLEALAQVGDVAAAGGTLAALERRVERLGAELARLVAAGCEIKKSHTES